MQAGPLIKRQRSPKHGPSWKATGLPGSRAPIGTILSEDTKPTKEIDANATSGFARSVRAACREADPPAHNATGTLPPVSVRKVGVTHIFTIRGILQLHKMEAKTAGI